MTDDQRPDEPPPRPTSEEDDQAREAADRAQGEYPAPELDLPAGADNDASGTDSATSNEADSPDSVEAEASLDLEQMEADIRRRLQTIVHRAKQAEKDARSLIGRVKPMLPTRKAIVELTDPANQHVARLSAAAHEVSQETALAVRQVTAQVGRDVSFRREMVIGREYTWRQFESTVFMSADAWFRAVGEQHDDKRERLDALQTRIRAAVKRWRPKEK